MRPVLAVVGNGMVGHRFVEALVARDLQLQHRLVVFGAEPRPAYDRVHLSSLFDGMDASDLSMLAEPGWYERNGIELRCAEQVERLDPSRRTLLTASGFELEYDRCVLATGSRPFVPPVPGADAAGCFVYRTVEDVAAIGAWASAGAARGVVVGGGLLGLEAANALRNLGLATTVVEFAPHLMAVQLDPGGGRMLRRHVEDLGIEVLVGHGAAEVLTTPDGRVAGLGFVSEEHPVVDTDLVVFAAGVRPRDDLARAAALELGERGGVVVDDALRTSDPAVFAIGEVACHRGRVHGLVAPGYAMADVLAARLAGDESARFEGADTATTLKLLGVDVSSAGATSAPEGGDEVVVADPGAGTYRKLVLDPAGRVAGAVLVGDTRAYPVLVTALRTGRVPGPGALELLMAAGGGDDATLCSCHNVTSGAVRGAIRDAGLEQLAEVKACTRAGTGCGSCVGQLDAVLREELVAAGKTVRRGLCTHFDQTRAELFDVMRITGIRSFADLVSSHGRGRGCDICKPAVASMLASLSSGYILDGEQATLQDTNDSFLANLQRDGTYSVVPRIPGGEITPERLIAIGEVAREFDLYTKITGGQRIDLFGARVEQLPSIWRRLVDAGFESGHAYGKAVRTVKSCVGSTWCRYGVQDSVQLAIDLEMRYRGLRAPHKLKLAVSGCARECAEAQSKDVGVIATESGWNLYVGGNGGTRPRHAELLAEDLDTPTLVRTIDRFLAYYIRTAERLERTAAWLERFEGGVAQLRRIVCDDSLGIAAELEADLERHVASYRCEWRETLEDPERLARFRPFVNSDTADPDLRYVRVRGQRQPETSAP